MCLTTISWSRPHQTTNNPTGPARDNPPLATLLLYDLSLNNRLELACENIRFSSLFVAGDVSRGGTSATQRQKFHTDDANQCLHNKSGSHGVPNINLSNFACLLVHFGKVLC